QRNFKHQAGTRLLLKVEAWRFSGCWSWEFGCFTKSRLDRRFPGTRSVCERSVPMAGRILVIRGGAIGDFILTLPAIRLLRENFPEARLEILGYEHIVALAEGRFYAEATHSIEYGALAGFFIPGSDLAADLQEYFAS